MPQVKERSTRPTKDIRRCSLTVVTWVTGKWDVDNERERHCWRPLLRDTLQQLILSDEPLSSTNCLTGGKLKRQFRCQLRDAILWIRIGSFNMLPRWSRIPSQIHICSLRQFDQRRIFCGRRGWFHQTRAFHLRSAAVLRLMTRSTVWDALLHCSCSFTI